MRWFYSDNFEAAVDQLELSGSEMLDVLREDLEMLHLVDLSEIDQMAEMGSLQYFLGPSGRVRYWMGLIGDDAAVIEFFDFD
jgi:hypothetical protein